MICIIDGDNVIHRIKELREHMEKYSKDDAIHYFANEYLQILKGEIYLIVDGANPCGLNEERIGKVKVVYSYPKEADDIIKEFVRRKLNKKGEILVISGDNEIKTFAKNLKVKTENPIDFWKRLNRKLKRRNNG